MNLPLPAGANGIRLPASTLIFRDTGMQVAVVGQGNKIEMRPVTITRDNGASVDIAPGALHPNDRIVDNPPDALQVGDVVQVAQGKPGAQGQGQGQTGAAARTGNPQQ